MFTFSLTESTNTVNQRKVEEEAVQTRQTVIRQHKGEQQKANRAGETRGNLLVLPFKRLMSLPTVVNTVLPTITPCAIHVRRLFGAKSGKFKNKPDLF